MGARLGACDYEPTHHPYFQLEIQLNQASGACRVPLAQRWAGNIVFGIRHATNAESQTREQHKENSNTRHKVQAHSA